MRSQLPPGDVPYWQPGMTLRDWFAGQALPGLVSGYATAYGSPTSASIEVCKEAYKYADTMLEERNK